MANVKINQLPLATTPLTGTEVFPLVQGTTTKQVSVANLFTDSVMVNPTLGTVGQADLINATGLPISTGVAGLGSGIATFLGTPSSANLRAAVTDETGTGALVFATSPTLVTPNLGTPSAMVATNITGTALGLIAGSAVTNANLTGAVTSVGNATSLGSFTSAQLRTALTDETGSGVAVFATSPTITAPVLNQINDTNGNQIVGLSPTASAVDYVTIKNGIGTGVPLHVYADGSSTNIGLHIQPKGSGLVTISDGTDFNKGIRFRSSGSAASAITLLDAVATAGRVVTLPDATTTLVGRDTTDTLTNKTIAFASNTFSGTLPIANGGTNASTAASAIENLLPAYSGNGSKGLRLNSGATALEWVADGGGTVTSVGGTGTVSGITLSGTVTTSGNLTLGGALDLSAYNGAGAFTTLSASSTVTLSGGTANGVTYLNGSKVLTSGSALTFNGSDFGVSASIATATLASSGTYSALSFTNSGGATTAGTIITNASGILQTRAETLAWTNYNASSEYMRLTSTGLGIGTSSPQSKLDFGFTNTALTWTFAADPSTYQAGLTFDATNRILKLFTKAPDSTRALQFSAASDGSAQVTLNSSGNLGLGVTPSAWQSGYKVFDIGNGAVHYPNSASQICVSANAYFNSGWIYKSTGNATLALQNAGQHVWYTAASGTAGNAISFTQAMTLDASGNLGVGTTSPGCRIDARGTSLISSFDNSVGVYSRWKHNGTNVGIIGTANQVVSGGSTSGFAIGTELAGELVFATNNAERARIDSSGNLLVGTTTSGVGNTGGTGIGYNAGASYQSIGHINGTASGSVYVSFGYNGSAIANITQSGTTAVLYNVTSDQRLKENIQDADSASSLIDSLQVRKFDWKTDQTHQRYGFVAQELVTVAPEAVHQPTDTEQMMAVDYSKLVPMLVKEIQSLRARVAQLESN